MGYTVLFRLRAVASDDTEASLGYASFSAFTPTAQHRLYGLDFLDCLTFDCEKGPEMIGAVEDSDGDSGWYAPDWTRAALRVDALWDKVQLLSRSASETHRHRFEYDSSRLPVFRDLIHTCAAHPNRERIQVRITC